MLVKQRKVLSSNGLYFHFGVSTCTHENVLAFPEQKSSLMFGQPALLGINKLTIRIHAGRLGRPRDY